MNYSKQTLETPLFEKLFWSRPEHKAAKGKLLVVGGNKFGFSAPAQAYNTAIKAGTGEVRVALPDAIAKIVGGFFEHALFLASTPSGSFAQKSLTELLGGGNWADGVLLAGDIGKNAETTVLIEEFCRRYNGPLIVVKDVLSLLQAQSRLLLDRQQTFLVANMQQLQKIAMHYKFEQAFTFDMPHQQLVDKLAALSERCEAVVIVKRLHHVFVAYKGSVSSTLLTEDKDVWRLEMAAYLSVWTVQNTTRPFEAATCAVYEYFGGSLSH